MPSQLNLDSIEKKNLLALLLLTGGSLFFWLLPLTAGVLIGGIIVILNLRVLRKITESLLKEKQEDIHRAFLFFSYLIRFIFVGGIVFAILYFEIIHPAGFLLGLSTVFFGVTLEIISKVFKS